MEMFKEFTFEAAHQVPPYSDVHGHSFFVEVTLKGEPHPKFGWAASLTDIEPLLHAVRQDLDHRYLNDIEGLALPSLENIARWIWRRLDGSVPGLNRVTVRRGSAGQGEGCIFDGQMVDR